MLDVALVFFGVSGFHAITYNIEGVDTGEAGAIALQGAP
jgi:hypothetical protein